MQHISIDDNYARSLTLEQLKEHFRENGYDWSETDIEGYWNSLQPAVIAVIPETPIQTLLKKEQELQDEINTFTDGTKRNEGKVSKPD